MSSKFVIRFACVLLTILLVVGLGIHFMVAPELTTMIWIFTVPLILAVPILLSVVFATDDELQIPAHK